MSSVCSDPLCIYVMSFESPLTQRLFDKAHDKRPKGSLLLRELSFIHFMSVVECLHLQRYFNTVIPKKIHLWVFCLTLWTTLNGRGSLTWICRKMSWQGPIEHFEYDKTYKQTYFGVQRRGIRLETMDKSRASYLFVVVIVAYAIILYFETHSELKWFNLKLR